MTSDLFGTAAPPPAAPIKPLIGVTMGDPGGIGAEVIVKALQDPDIRALGRFVIYCSTQVMEDAADSAGVRPFWFTVSPDEALRMDSGVVAVNVADCPPGFCLSPRPTPTGGKASLAFLDAAIEAARDGRQTDCVEPVSVPADGCDSGRDAGAAAGRLAAIVTGPINKTSWKLAGVRFPGHTELLADRFKSKRVTMAFVGGGLRIALASAHIGLLSLRNAFTLGMVFQAIDLLDDALKRWFGVARPRIAVCGLNPHAGEGGQFGDEESRVIEPAMEMARNAGINVEGPFPADTLFTPKLRSRFDGIVAMYHDQGLIPLKMLAFDTAVNVTLGLPIIRTSPDHGTAFDIAGMNQADPGSMKEAIRLACQLASKATHASSVAPHPDIADWPAATRQT
ncbi:MAG: 4-hydroxythreonine-4-phosphate dehydrogenase PdxA [Planctomycetes bacterium]|nr:4-hydroxythreonine-4-phosphate dehydrogenase PdxA [Planctomycetota bacterium]